MACSSEPFQPFSLFYVYVYAAMRLCGLLLWQSVRAYCWGSGPRNGKGFSFGSSFLTVLSSGKSVGTMAGAHRSSWLRTPFASSQAASRRLDRASTCGRTVDHFTVLQQPFKELFWAGDNWCLSVALAEQSSRDPLGVRDQNSLRDLLTLSHSRTSLFHK